MQPSDVLRLRRGSHWNETLEIRSDGANRAPITILSYGSGPLPIISRNDSPELYPAVLLDGDRIVCMQIHVDDALGFGIRMRGLSSAVRYCEVSNAG